MTIDRIFVIIIGCVGVIGTYRFFLRKKGVQALVASDAVNIIVKGGYTPDVIALQRGKPATITFIRRDPSNCLEEVILADFGIRKTLPLNEDVSITIHPEQSGEFPFSCGMGMFHGKIVVV